MSAPDPEAGRFEGRIHLLPVRVYYEDTDFTGVVYHANYARYLERGRTDFLRVVGIRHAALLEDDPPTAFVVTRLGLAFRAPARIDDALVVRTAYDEVRGPRLLISQQIMRGETVLVAAEVEAASVGLDGRPRRPSPALMRALAPWLAPPAP